MRRPRTPTDRSPARPRPPGQRHRHPATAAAATCDENHWPAATQGVPTTYKAGARAGDYIWHSSTGWHVRVTHPGSRRVVFTGRIVSDTPLTVSSVKLEKWDAISLSADKLTLTYRFVNYGRIDGFDFRTACATKLHIKGGMSGVEAAHRSDPDRSRESPPAVEPVHDRARRLT